MILLRQRLYSRALMGLASTGSKGFNRAVTASKQQIETVGQRYVGGSKDKLNTMIKNRATKLSGASKGLYTPQQMENILRH